MPNLARRALLVLCPLLLSLAAAPAVAQVNTAGVRGAVTADDGTPLEFAEVTLVHEPSKNRKQSVTNAAGEFAFTGLRVGGPYSLTIESVGFLPAGVRGITLSAGKNARVAIVLKIAGEVIEVEGTSVPTTTSQRFKLGAEEIGALPSVGRDPKDAVRMNPDAYLDGDQQALSIAGTNSRFNSVTIDGIRQDDDFGLNGNGYPTQRSPIGLDSIEEISVEQSPFDARYGSFLGGNVNIVTKSGGNDFHGSVFGAYASDALTGSRSGNAEPLELDFREIRYGATLGGPIVKDKLHFFVSVEGLSATTPVSVGPEGSGEANEISGVTQADVDRARQIAESVYGFDAGVPGQSLDEFDLKLMTKVDWAINDHQRLSAKYQRTGGNAIEPSSAFGTRLPLTSNWYDRSDTLHAFSLRLLSDWTPSFSTQAEISGKLVDTEQDPLSGNDFPEVEILTADGGSIVIGPDVFRHANELSNNVFHVKLEGTQLLQRHLLTAGVEYDRLWIFNLFVPSSRGDATYESLDAFENRMPMSLFYSNATSNDPDDAAANWGYGVVAAFAQDQFEITDQLTVQGGVRVEAYHAEDNITENDNFIDRYGFSNTSTISGEWIAMPRAGVTFRPIPWLNLRGGAGLFSGGTPNVWVSNNYTNDGVTIDSAFSNDPTVLAGFDGRTIPAELQDQLVPGDGSVDALDPDFAIPSSWKLAAGADAVAPIPGFGNLGVEVNYVYTEVRDGLRWIDLRRNLDSIPSNQPIGTLPDGRPFYDNDNSDGESFNVRRGFDMLLTNTPDGGGHNVSLALRKALPFGLSIYGAYAYQNVDEINPATSSRSVSNYGLAAVEDPNILAVATSNYERAHRFISSIQYAHPLIADIAGEDSVWKGLPTVLSLVVESRSGQPYSYTFGDATGGSALAALFGEDLEFGRRQRMLFYVPRGDGSDVVLDGIDPVEFAEFLDRTGLDKYRGQIAPRNAFSSRWLNRWDARIAQALPGPFPGQRARLMVDVQNVGNLLNREWGVNRQVPFPYIVPVVDVNVDAQGRYVYSNLRTQDPQTLNVLASIWRVQFTLVYEF